MIFIVLFAVVAALAVGQNCTLGLYGGKWLSTAKARPSYSCVIDTKTSEDIYSQGILTFMLCDLEKRHCTLDDETASVLQVLDETGRVLFETHLISEEQYIDEIIDRAIKSKRKLRSNNRFDDDIAIYGAAGGGITAIGAFLVVRSRRHTTTTTTPQNKDDKTIIELELEREKFEAVMGDLFN